MLHHADHRANPRQCVRLHVDLENAKAGECPAITLDLSNSGARLLTSGHIDTGERVALTLHPTQGSEQSVRANGTAVWVLNLEMDRKWGRMLAMEFDAPLSESGGFSLDCLGPGVLE